MGEQTPSSSGGCGRRGDGAHPLHRQLRHPHRQPSLHAHRGSVMGIWLGIIVVRIGPSNGATNATSPTVTHEASSFSIGGATMVRALPNVSDGDAVVGLELATLAGLRRTSMHARFARVSMESSFTMPEPLPWRLELAPQSAFKTAFDTDWRCEPAVHAGNGY